MNISKHGNSELSILPREWPGKGVNEVQLLLHITTAAEHISHPGNSDSPCVLQCHQLTGVSEASNSVRPCIQGRSQPL